MNQYVHHSRQTSVTFALILLTVVLAFCDVSSYQHRPAVGILTTPLPDELSHYGNAIIPGSYVKWLDQGGHRVVFIPYEIEERELAYILPSLSGVVLPGGWGMPSLSPKDPKDIAQHRTMKQIYDYAMGMNRAGNPFAIWAVCLGFEYTAILAAGKNILTTTDSQNTQDPLWAGDIEGTRLLGALSDEMVASAFKDPLFVNYHRYGVLPGDFNVYAGDDWRIVATQLDRQGLEYVAAIEHTDYPIYGVQWHPERAGYEARPSFPDVPTALKSMHVSHHMSMVFAEETRKSPAEYKLGNELLAQSYIEVVLNTPKDLPFETAYFF
ncbi:Peptidase C26 [Carpediemonas membranifera]|uniref:folate gamma-glutamyl hydrolase n=1 Tax=Carpediemonas membranifera TaxID=201153 RepID=A0A8J6DY76_9EUKA|nr:Peptidase C26 [Carpediemonas membranifera]|eukprot:KAG9391689.1 Peptidase C26 [Carpediemonas membranifera]